MQMDELIYPMPIKSEGAVYPLTGGYFYDELIKSIDNAQSSIFSIQYLWKWNIHERNSKVQRLGACIIRAIKRNVAVNVLLNTESPRANLTKVNSFTADQLIRNGAQVKLLRTSGLLHTKLWIVDSRDVYVGSHNISCRSLGVNEEVSVKIESESLAKFMRIYFDTLWGVK